MYNGNEQQIAEQVAGAVGQFVACFAVFGIIIMAFFIWVFWRILTRAGYSGWLSLLNLVGGLGTFVLLMILAFGDWPSLRRGSVAYGEAPATYGQPTPPPAAPTYTPPAPPQAVAPTYAPPAAPPAAPPTAPPVAPPVAQPPVVEEPPAPSSGELPPQPPQG